MAKPSKPAAGPTPAPASKPAASKPVARTEVRNSPIPQTAPPPPRPTTAPKSVQPQQQPRAATPQSAAVRPAAKAVTHELIARRAYEIWASGQGGSETENWIRAERELRGM
jgi:hypothetical protein